MQGQSAFEYWNTPENEITICDQDENLKFPDGASVHLGRDHLKNLHEFDLLVRSPIVHPRDILTANPEHPDILDRVTSVTNEFFQVCPSRNIIGVTGTKGKGTTSTLIAKMLEACGKTVHLGGNIGTPPLELLKAGIKPTDWVVLELANFQLVDLKHSPHIGVCLMVEPEHMDWHEDMEEYIAAKQQLFIHQKPDDIAIYYAKSDNSHSVAGASQGRLIPYFAPPGAVIENNEVIIDGQSICRTDELKLLGEHNWQNVCAAVTAVWQVNQYIGAMCSVLTTFTGLEHRLEFVREVDGVKYYDDSFGTTPETAVVAIEAFDEPKVLILGGSDKGSKFDVLAQTIKSSNVRQIVLIGNTANEKHKSASPELLKALDAAGIKNTTSLVKDGPTTMTEIVEAARSAARPGDVVLLSTGCASFDLFDNYKDRGEQFKKAVLELS